MHVYVCLCSTLALVACGLLSFVGVEALYGCICDGDITSRADAGRPLYRDPRYDGANGAARHEDYLSDLTDASREEDDKLRLLSVVDVLPTECR